MEQNKESLFIILCSLCISWYCKIRIMLLLATVF